MITISNPASKTSQTDTNNQALNFDKTRKQLSALSNTKLLNDLDDLNHKERQLKILVLLYLAELDKRDLYLPMGFSSLFDFCTGHLGYTRATAVRRIRAARTCAKYPAALDMLISGEINITTLSMISDILDRDNHAELLSKIQRKSTRQVEMLVSEHRPVSIIRDSVRPVCIKRRVRESEAARGAAGDRVSGPGAETGPMDLHASSIPVARSDSGIGCLNLSPREDTGDRKSNKLSSSAERNQAGPGDERRNSNKISSSAGTKISPKGRVILEQRLKLGFSVSPEFMAKFNKIKSLLSSTYPEGIDFETLFEHLMNEYLERHDPERKRERRIKRANSRANTTRKNRREKGRPANRRSRHIPPATRDQVYARDKGRCTFVGANGKRCNATWDLEIDHIVPFAKGGDNSPENLRLLCRKHNIHQAEKTYGRELVKNKSG